MVDSGASIHMLSKKNLSSAELETLGKSRNTTTVITANVEVQTNEEAQVYVQDIDLFVTVQILDDTPAVLSLGKLCEEHGYTCQWASGQKATSDQELEQDSVQYGKFRACCCCCPRTVVKLQRKFVFHSVPAGLIWYHIESSKFTT